MEDILNVIKTRRSVRKFKPEMPSEADLNKILEAGTYAPTGKNRQAPIILCVTDKKVRDELSALNCEIGGWEKGFDPFYGAPAILIVLVDKSVNTAVYDGSLVMENMMLEAHSLGLGSIWIHRAKEAFETEYGKALLHKLGIEGNYEGIGHCAVGFAEGELPAPVKRKENWIYRI